MTLDLTKYNDTSIGMSGLQEVFKLCHIPHLVYNDVYGALALEGSSGTGKTTIVERIGKLNKMAGGGNVRTVSADKTRYEDFIGCPLPPKNDDKKEMELYHFPNAIATMETLLVDETNRANPESQEKYLSLFASRTIDGFQANCKYIYAAMNPIMGEGADQYEGTVPLDKALGERMMALVTMPKFYEMSPKEQSFIIKASFNQTKWEPSDSLVQLHSAFLAKAREFYEQFKEEHTDSICEYIHSVQKLLNEPTDGAIIEARRAQFILTNILSVYALNTIYVGINNIENSALEALTISFPGKLWEQPISLPALKQAHAESKKYLKLDRKTRKTQTQSTKSLEIIVDDFEELTQKGSTLEDRSKFINQHVPNATNQPLEHYLYALAGDNGFRFPDGSQEVIQAQEYDRLELIAKQIKDTDVYKKAVKDGEYLKANGEFPSGYEYPEYIDINMTEKSMDSFHRLADQEICAYVQAVQAENPGIYFSGGEDFIEAVLLYAEAMNRFRGVANKVREVK
jgi:MoxR-like ATPase